jgi:hypothetical protein
MEPARMVILELGPQTCPEDHSRQMVRLLRDSQRTWTIDTQIVTRCPLPTLLPPPDIICLQPSAVAKLPQILRLLRQSWDSAALFGLFCMGTDTPAVAWHGLFDGLADYCTCPFRDIDVLPRVQRLLRNRGERSASHQAGERTPRICVEGLVGESPPFLRVLHVALEVAHTDATVLLSGETGTGKELIARAIHYESTRRSKPFVPVNCGALPEHLVENELFGHAKGAYTDAASPEKGLVAEAEQGTLFLDEVDTLSASAQVKLLRFLQEREYRPLGSAKQHVADVRVIAATNTNLQQHVQAQRFREDLYYRLNIVALCHLYVSVMRISRPLPHIFYAAMGTTMAVDCCISPQMLYTSS